ncbi:type II toxin-antitoxin system VapC family toxin [Microcystis aeruginosa]|jgi:PIN domain nuclease of toxin-antitoxin system|uniref:Type II toxin-antitoxin system VapC family toxin n=1 Tax=Microcystis aeruginosa Ma_QC_C_20070703_M131 TaxID=2486263 RepID=A0A551XPN4_MICAE|nr:type II toxin-antitoxin system VapC family toxin [Microcystis aeruginosa]MDB9391569.1 type II toxin-antitoxin system VapC family toxin [Microcystis aeruginosa CS-579]TRT50659.1 MAG: type II toxin-antitoxin system VapC family toxin [Microcystis aeruginosa Ma_QC_C_20070703_M131]
MKLLLDTHTFIWWDSEPEKLSQRALELCRNPTNILLLSIASVWEMQIKLQLGKLSLKLPLAQMINTQQQTNQLELLSITVSHVLALNTLPNIHKDPFDRLLVAQANIENVILISHDLTLAKYPVQINW